MSLQRYAGGVDEPRERELLAAEMVRRACWDRAAILLEPDRWATVMRWRLDMMRAVIEWQVSTQSVFDDLGRRYGRPGWTWRHGWSMRVHMMQYLLGGGAVAGDRKRFDIWAAVPPVSPSADHSAAQTALRLLYRRDFRSARDEALQVKVAALCIDEPALALEILQTVIKEGL